MTPTEKPCTKCGLPKPLSEFRPKKRGKHGRNSICRECERVELRQWREANREHVKQYGAEWREANREHTREYARQRYWSDPGRFRRKSRAYYVANRERLIEASKQWRLDNPERHRASKRRWNTVHPDPARERAKRWRLANPDWAKANSQKYYYNNIDKAREQHRQWKQQNRQAVKASHQRRRARKQSLPDTFTTAEWLHCLYYWHNCCAYCGAQRGLWSDITADHFIPLTNASCPGTVAENMVPACLSCNSSKGAGTALDWLTSKIGSRRKAQAIVEKIAKYFASLTE